MRKQLLVIALVAACGGKKDEQAPPPPKASKPAPETPPGPGGKPAPKRATVVTPAQPKLDCAALLTADDVAKACGGGALTAEASPMEKGEGAMTCVRWIGDKKSHTGVTLTVNTAPGSPEGAKNLVAMSKKGGAAEVAVGDAAIQVDHAVEAAKGSIWFKLTPMESLCKDDALVQLATTVASRLP